MRVASYCELVRAASLIELGTREQNVSAVHVRSRALGVSLDRSIVPRHRFSNVALFLKRVSFIDQRDREVPRCNWRAVVNFCSRRIHASPLEVTHPISF